MIKKLNSDNRLLKYLKKMDIPFYRKENFDKNNLLWLQKNLKARNHNKIDYQETIKIIDNKINNKDYSS